MNLQSLLAFSPFLALVYVLYGFIQAARGKQQGVVAVLLAVIALAAPLAVLLLIKDTTVQTPLLNYLTLNGIIVFVASLVILFIEKRRAKGSLKGSYGMLGVGLGVLLAAGTFVSPLLPTVAASSGTTTATSSAFTDALTAQTGLTSAEVTTQVQSGSTIAQLVAAHGGDLNAVITAAASALDEIIAGSGMPAQMLSRLGDTTETATKFVQGELQDRAQQMLIGVLMGSGGGFPGAGQNPPNGTPGAGMPALSGTPGADFAPPSDANGTPMLPPGDGSGFPADGAGMSDAPASEPTIALPTSSPTPTEVVVRPTLIVFPSITPTPAVTEPPATATTAAALCTITINYNLNLRAQPNTDSDILGSIPYGSSVPANGRNAEGWYSVVYDGQSGWVSGEFATPDAACTALPVSQ